MSNVTDLSNVRATVDKANGLPNAHYIDPGVFDEEKQALLNSQWAGLAVAADVPEPGEAKPIEFLGCATRTATCGCSRTSAATAA